jgi:hypothetical protein
LRATVTLNVDRLGAKPLRTSPGVGGPSGMPIQGTPYVASYNNATGNGSSVHPARLLVLHQLAVSR